MKQFPVFIITIIICLLFTGCGPKSYDGPPDPGTPEPPYHDGSFISEYGTMTFNGDGETVYIDFLLNILRYWIILQMRKRIPMPSHGIALVRADTMWPQSLISITTQVIPVLLFPSILRVKAPLKIKLPFPIRHPGIIM